MLTHLPSSAADLAAQTHSPVLKDRFARHDRRSLASRPQMRRYEIAYLSQSNEIAEKRLDLPALDVIDAAFSAFARGALIATARGHVAIEDLIPGDMIMTARHGARKLMWKGSMELPEPADTDNAASAGLIRFCADRFALGDTMPDLLLGPNAWIYNAAHAARCTASCNGVFSPAADFVDGETVFNIRPMGAVTVYHMALDAHSGIMANGIEVESYHPGDAMNHLQSMDDRQMFKSVFPHLNAWGEFGGLCLPRMTKEELSLRKAG